MGFLSVILDRKPVGSDDEECIYYIWTARISLQYWWFLNELLPHHTPLLSFIYPSYVSLREVWADLFIGWGLPVFSGGGWPGRYSVLGLFESNLKLLLGFWMLDEQKKSDFKTSYLISWSLPIISAKYQAGNTFLVIAFSFPIFWKDLHKETHSLRYLHQFTQKIYNTSQY